MNDRTWNGFMLSAALHAAVALALFLGYLVSEQAAKRVPKVLELVAGEGDNYMATEAPALGVPGGLKVPIPDIPAEKPAPPEPSPVQAAPPEPIPEPVVQKAPPVVEKKPVVEKAPVNAKAPSKEELNPNFAKDVKRIQDKRFNRLETKRKAEEARKAKEEELKKKRMTKEEFDRQNRAEAAAKKNGGSVKVSKIDAEGIAKGVVGGSTANKIGGAGGKALTRDEGDALDLYFSLLKQKLKEALDKPPGLSDSLVATAEVRIGADGSLSGARIKRSSGSSEFDEAVLQAIARVRSIGAKPDGKSEVLNIPFRMREEDEN